MAVSPLLVPSAGRRRAPRRRVSGPDERLRNLARSQAPVRHALATLAARFVALRGWEPLGYARLRDYAAERLGLSERSVQDFAYVGRASAGLPGLAQCLANGDLAWSKVRLLARVATAGDEAHWIDLARALGVRALEHEVRRVDVAALENGGAETDPESESGDGEVTEGVRIRCSGEVRARWWRTRVLANRMAGEAVPVWVAMEQVAAEVASALPLEGPVDGREPVAAAPAVATRRRIRRPAAGACALRACAPLPSGVPPQVCALLEGLEHTDAFELDARMRRAVACEQRLDAELSALLLEVFEAARRRRWGHRDFASYVREHLGMSPRKARALLRLERAGRPCPALLAAYREGRLSWVQAHALVPVVLADAPHSEAWVRFALRVSVRRLVDEVGRAVACAEAGKPPPAAPPANEAQADPSAAIGAVGSAERQTCARATSPTGVPREDARPFFSAPRPVARFFRAVLCSTRRHLERRTGRLPTEGEAFGWMLDHALGVWVEAWESGDPDARRTKRAHAVFARDGWRCTVPGCTSYRNLHDHHIRFRSAGGSDEMGNRTTLCAHHHQRGVHAGILRCTGRAPERLRFELGLRAGRPPLEVFRSGDIRC